MESKYTLCKIGDLVTFQNGYAFKSSEFILDGNCKVIKIKELKDGKVRFFDDTATIDYKDEYKAFVIKKNDILFALTGDPVSKPNPLSWVGRVSVYDNETPALLNQRVCKVICSDKINSYYLYYYFRQQGVFYSLAAKATGSASQANISTKTIADTDILLPCLDEQKKIVSILNALDNKIKLNNEINSNLEQQAQVIFDKYLNLQEIPKGWVSSNLLDVADYLNGLAMQKYRPEENETGLPVLKIKELRQGCCDANSELCSENINPNYIIRNGDVIFSWSGSLLVDFWCGGKCGLNQHLFKVSSSKYDKWFYYAWTKHHLNRFIAIASDMATTMGHIKREELSKAIVFIPTDEEYKHIGSLLAPIYDAIISNRLENNHLASVRDSLLPKLMSGEIDLSNISI